MCIHMYIYIAYVYLCVFLNLSLYLPIYFCMSFCASFCLCVILHVQNPCNHAYVHECLPIYRVSLYPCMNVFLHDCVYSYMYIRTYAFMYVCLYIIHPWGILSYIFEYSNFHTFNVLRHVRVESVTNVSACTHSTQFHLLHEGLSLSHERDFNTLRLTIDNVPCISRCRTPYTTCNVVSINSPFGSCSFCTFLSVGNPFIHTHTHFSLSSLCLGPTPALNFLSLPLSHPSVTWHFSFESEYVVLNFILALISVCLSLGTLFCTHVLLDACMYVIVVWIELGLAGMHVPWGGGG